MVFLSNVSCPSISLEGAECVVARKAPELLVGDDVGEAWDVMEKGSGGEPSMREAVLCCHSQIYAVIGKV